MDEYKLIQRFMNMSLEMDSRMVKLEDRILNIENFKNSIQKSIDDFVEECDVSSKEWIEVRLSALEHQVQGLRNSLIEIGFGIQKGMGL